MNKVIQIGLNTFRESVRDKILYVIIFFSLMMMGASQGLGWVSVGEELQIVEHFSLAVVSFFGALISVFVGTGLIYKEIDKRTIYTILSKPVYRWQFIVGKFFGLMMVLFCVIAGMGLSALLFVAYSAATRSGTPTEGWTSLVLWDQYLLALVLVFFEVMIITAIAIFFSTVSSPVLSALFTFCSYLIGQVTPDLIRLTAAKFAIKEGGAAETGEHLSTIVAYSHWLLKPFAEVMYWVLPNLTYFQGRNRVVYGELISATEMGYAILYAVCYSGMILMLAVFLFERKKF